MRTELTIDLGAVAANWRAVAAVHGAPTAAVVKADAYGLGAARVAPALAAAGVRDFFVATAEEAVALRPLLPSATIAVLHGYDPDAAGFYTGFDLFPVLATPAQIAAYQARAREISRPLPAMLHLDSGMNRLGLGMAELRWLTADAGRMAGIDWRYALSHLSSSERADDPLNHLELGRFKEACALLPPMKRSLANSSGIFLGAAFRSDLARPGAALYGINPTPGRPNPLRPVARLTAPVLQVRNIAPGETVGYNATWTAARPTRIATVGYGYADGYCRAAAGRAEAAFDGARVPLIGRISMDLATFDVTDHPGVVPGARLELIGPSVPVDEFAGWAGTIGYEILTSLGHRAARLYAAL